MSKSIESRVGAAEKKAGVGAGQRRGYTLEQLIRAARGEELGAPTKVLQPGEPSLEELIAACSPPDDRES